MTPLPLSVVQFWRMLSFQLVDRLILFKRWRLPFFHYFTFVQNDAVLVAFKAIALAGAFPLNDKASIASYFFLDRFQSGIASEETSHSPGFIFNVQGDLSIVFNRTVPTNANNCSRDLERFVLKAPVSDGLIL